MKLNITKPLVVFDLETTGLDLVNDRIIQISYIKVMPSGEEKRENIFVNPGKPIPPLVQQLTGITDADVADAPSFRVWLPRWLQSLRVATLPVSTQTISTFPCLPRSFSVLASTSISPAAA